MARARTHNEPLPEQPLSADDASLRDRCEQSAREQFPGARVLVEREKQGVIAAVVLPEDGADLDASALYSSAHGTAREALSELAHMLQRQTRPLSAQKS